MKCDELKATTAQEIVREEKVCDYMDELIGGVKMPPTQVYLKSEADKVLANLEESHKKEVEQLLIEIVKQKDKLDLYKRGFAEDDKINAYLYKELRHQKYKRCVAMAKWCKCKRIDAADYRIPREKWEFYDKWYKRWLKLAEKFKPNSTAQQGKG